MQELEQRLARYLGVDYLLLVANGTLALNIAYAALGIMGKVITTPFSFAATASSLCWQGIEPHFVDIDKQSLNLDINKVSASLAHTASAILPVHVFGNPCEVNEISVFAKQHQLKVVYDAAHAFASDYGEKSLVSFGDAATLSLHATKLFHSVEGGAVIFKDKHCYEKAKLLINFGFNKHNYPEYVGINAKMSEFHAAMGLTVFDDIDYITTKRKQLITYYHEQLAKISQVNVQQWHIQGQRNGAYMPVILHSEQLLEQVMAYLTEQGTQTRRYFYPSLSQVEVYGQQGETPIADDIAKRVLCLPLYTDLVPQDIDIICMQLKAALAGC